MMVAPAKEKVSHPDLRVMDGLLVLRSVDEDSRTAEFVAATEGGVMTYMGQEYLRINGVMLDRYRKNPVVLDCHNRYSAEDVVGSAKVKKVNRELLAVITFAETPRGENVWLLVKGGHLRAVSVGFFRNPKKTIQLEEGQFDGKGESRIEGPAVVVKEWELLEISVVPVPADQDAVRRSLMEGVEPMADTASRKTEPAQGGAGKQQSVESNGDASETQRQEVLTDGERKTRDLKATHEAIRAICPKGLESHADQAILEGLSFEDARKRFLEAHTQSQKPVGHQEPEQPEGNGRGRAEGQSAQEEAEGKRDVKELDEDVLLRSLTT